MPKDVKHGAGGYARGCKCSTCRAGHAAYMRQWRARKAAPRPEPAPGPMPAPLASLPSVDPDAPPGRLEQALDLDFAGSTEPTGARGFLVALARYNARMLDQLPGLDRLDLVSPLQSRTLDILARLGSSKGESITDGELARFMAELNEPGDGITS